jgi:hypothetical protein
MFHRRALLGSVRTPFAPAAYTGPGDVVGSALAWYSPARAYSAAFAAAAGPIMDIVDSANGNAATINILTTGLVDLVTLDAWIVAHGTASVKQLYDQTGNARHVSNATVSQMPTITQSAINGLPALTGTAAANTSLTSSATITETAPWAWTAVAKRTANFTTAHGLIGSSGAFNGYLGFTTSADTVGVTTTGAAFATLGSLTDNNFHALQGIVDGASSLIAGDGTDGSTASAGTTNMSSNTIRVMRFAGGSSLTGQMMEAGLWPVGFDGTQRTNMNSNMHGANGYNF